MANMSMIPGNFHRNNKKSRNKKNSKLFNAPPTYYIIIIAVFYYRVVKYSRTSTNWHLSTTATSLHIDFFWWTVDTLTFV